MAFIYRDALSPQRASTFFAMGIRKKFDDAWPKSYVTSYNPWTQVTETIQVYNGRLNFYRDGFQDSLVLKRFVVSLGMNYEEFKSNDVDSEVNDMWFYIKGGFAWDGSEGFIGEYKDHDGPSTIPNDPSPNLDTPSRDDIARNINDVFKVDDEISITISYGGGLKRYMQEHELPWVATGGEVVSGGFDSETIQQKILTNPWYYIANSRHLPYIKDSEQFQGYDAGPHDMPKIDTYRPSSRVLSPCNVAISLEGYSKPPGGVEEPNIQLGLFALMADDKQWEPILNEDGSNIFDSITSTTNSGSDIGRVEGEILEHQFTLKFKFKETTPTSSYLKEMSSWYDSYYQDITTIPVTKMDDSFTVDTYKELQTTSTIDTKPKKAMVLMMTDPSAGFNSLYFNGNLRVDAVKAMKARDFGKMLSTQLDTDYDVDDASFFEKALSIVVIVVAVVLVIIGAIVSFFLPPIGGLIITAGVTLLTVGQFALAYFGGLSAQGEVKTIGKVAQIVGIAVLVVGIYIAYQKAAERALQEAVAEAVKKGASDAAIDAIEVSVFDVIKSVINNLVDSAVASILGDGSAFTATKAFSTASEAVNMASKGYELYADREKEDLKEEYEELEKKIKEDQEDRDMSRRIADPLFTLNNSMEQVMSYDAITYIEKDWKINHAPNKEIIEFYSERGIV